MKFFVPIYEGDRRSVRFRAAYFSRALAMKSKHGYGLRRIAMLAITPKTAEAFSALHLSACISATERP